MTPPTIGYGIQRALCVTRSQFDGTVMSDEKSASMAVQETRITAGAMRMRASRRRRREGMRCITIEFRETEIDPPVGDLLDDPTARLLKLPH